MTSTLFGLTFTWKQKEFRVTWCCSLSASRPWTGTAVPYTWSSRTIEHLPTSSGQVTFRPHFRKRSNPTRMSCMQTDKTDYATTYSKTWFLQRSTWLQATATNIEHNKCLIVHLQIIRMLIKGMLSEDQYKLNYPYNLFIRGWHHPIVTISGRFTTPHPQIGMKQHFNTDRMLLAWTNWMKIYHSFGS